MSVRALSSRGGLRESLHQNQGTVKSRDHEEQSQAGTKSDKRGELPQWKGKEQVLRWRTNSGIGNDGGNLHQDRLGGLP